MAKTISTRTSRADIDDLILNKNLRNILSLQADSVVTLDDHFFGPVLDANKWSVGNGGGASAASPVVSVGLQNGAIVAITGTAGDGTADSFISSGRHFKGDQNAVFRTRLKVGAAVASVKIECGFQDAIASATTHAVNSKSASTFISSDAVCWIYDTNDTGRGWDGMGIANPTAATRMTSYNVVPVADTYETLEIALIDGTAFFSHYTVDGLRDFGPVSMLLAVTKTVLLCPYVSVEARSATTKTLTIDRIKAFQAQTTAN